MPLRLLATLPLTSARLIVHLRPFHCFEVACSHSRISAGFAFQPDSEWAPTSCSDTVIRAW